MKEKIIGFIKENRGGIVLFCLVSVTALLAAMISHMCGALYASTLMLALGFGALSIVLVSSLYKICSIKAPMSLEWGVISLILSMFFLIAIY